MIVVLDKADLVDEIGLLRSFTVEVVRKSVASSTEEFILLRSMVENSFSKWYANGCRGFCARYMQETEMAGFIIVQNWWNLSHLFVHNDMQGKGIGKALLEQGLLACDGKSPTGEIKLNSSFAGQGFYQRMGFVKNGPESKRPGGCIPFRYRL